MGVPFRGQLCPHESRWLLWPRAKSPQDPPWPTPPSLRLVLPQILWHQFLKFKEMELPAKEADKSRSKVIFQSLEVSPNRPLGALVGPEAQGRPACQPTGGQGGLLRAVVSTSHLFPAPLGCCAKWATEDPSGLPPTGRGEGVGQAARGHPGEGEASALRV